jgi:hypothetical protein
VYSPIIDNREDMDILGIYGKHIEGKGIKLCFNSAINLNHCEEIFSITNFNFDTGRFQFVSPNGDDQTEEGFTTWDNIMVDPSTNKEFLEKEWS